MLDMSTLTAKVTGAAVMGGTVAAVMGTGTVLERAMRGFVGGLLSISLTPVVAPVFEHGLEKVLTTAGITVDLATHSVVGGVGFMLGVTGMVLAQETVNLVRRSMRKVNSSS